MLKNQNIVIFGATGTLGSHFWQKASALGANCVAVGRRTTEKITPDFRCDVTVLDDVMETAEKIYAQLPSVDTVINFTGVHHSPMDFAKHDPHQLAEDFLRVMNVNTTGAFYLTLAFAKKMVARRHGHIIHLCSDGSRLSLYGSYAYNSSKHAVEGLIKTAAAQLAPFNVRVNGVAPGTVETPLEPASAAFGRRPALQSARGSILAHTPTKKFASLDGISETISAMCLPQRHFTGNVVFCDDGYNIEGHSWPLGNQALFKGEQALQTLFQDLAKEYPIDQPKA